MLIPKLHKALVVSGNFSVKVHQPPVATLEKRKKIQILTKVYETICFIGVLLILEELKEGVGTMIALVSSLFLIPFLSGENKIKSIAFSIIFSFYAYCAWTVFLTFYLTNYLVDKRLIGEHSFWDILALSLPFILAVTTLVLNLKKRRVKNNYELFYIIVTIIAILLVDKLVLTDA